MKKIMALIVTLAIIGFGIYVGTRYLFKKEGLQVAEVLPEGALGYVQLKDLKNQLPGMASSPVWQNIKKINYKLLIGPENLTARDLAIFSMIENAFSDPDTNAMLAKFLGKECALAVYPADIDVADIQNKFAGSPFALVEEVLSKLFLVTRVDKDVQVAETVARSVNRFGSDVTTETESYKDHVIHLVSIKGSPVKLGYVRIQDLLIIGVGDRPAKQSVDVFMRDEQALNSDPGFKEAQPSFIDGAVSNIYWDIGRFFDRLQGQLDDLARLSKQPDGNVREQLRETFKNVQGFNAMAASFAPADLSKFRFDIFFDIRGMNPQMASFYRSCRSVENRTLKFVPKEALAYQWGTCLDLVYYWEEMKREMAQAPNAEENLIYQQVANLETVLGMNLERDLLPAFGKDIGGYITDIQMGGFFPIPQIVFFIEVRDSGKVTGLLNNIFSSQPYFTVQSQMVGTVEVKYLSLPLGDMLRPSYAMLGDYLLVSINQSTMQGAIQAYQGKSPTLADNQAFKQVDLGLTGPGTGLQFVQVDRVVDKFDGILDWSNQWLAAADKKREAFEKGQQLRLTEVENEIQLLEQEIGSLNERVTVIEDNIWNLESQGLDPSASRAELEAAKQEIEAKKIELASSREQKKDLEKIVQGYQEKAVGPERRQRLIDEVIRPLFNALKAIKAVGAKSTMTDNAVKSSMYIKM